jgi:hypothetical protein
VRRYFGDVLTDDQLAALTTISDAVVSRLAAEHDRPAH